MLIILVFVASIIIIFSVKDLKKNKNFSQILNETEDSLDDIDVKIGKLRREFSETILNLQLEIEDLKNIVEKDCSKEDVIRYDKIKDEYITKNEIYSTNKNMKNIEFNIETNSNNCTVSLSENSVKVEQIKTLYSQNFSVEEIADKLKLGKGEVLLIEELYLK
ncbi:hypothetical protein KQI36_01620 [Clostridium senegalense]|uniref:hypothetical protein n=1 Tax=Clostridium senegalense TaxID=1465809 RepID=UPI001C11C10D|nr:hypothetical protein [Clostridium senegalense]MBU5225364.1 hypothetical protein [Clostridium senegalense]